MEFTKADIEAVAEYVGKYYTLEVAYNEKNIFVIAESAAAINEFEARLVAGSLEWDGENVNGVIMLNALVDLQGVRTDFRKRYNDEWQARYDIVAE